MSETIRIRTTPNGSDKYLTIKLEQDFDFIEVLSLNISQQNAYQNFCADYGVVVGRVIINSGFGVPNAKVSIFIPLDTNDTQDPHISGLYPYTTVNDKNSDGIRYNLLPRSSDSQDICYTPVGTFPTKREVLDNDDMLYVYKKYYQFTTTTNYAGDFMLFGVPVGNHTVHVDMDISNIGIASQKPYDLIAQGAPSSMFFSPTKFKASTNLNSLPQIKTANASVNVQPFWGDTDNCQIGINRLDFDMNYNITPSAIFIGSVFGDNEKNSVNKRCIPRKNMGAMRDQETGSGMIEMIRKTTDNQIEDFDVEGGQLIDNNGAWAYQIPMNLDYMITAEDGTLTPSSDPNIGIPTKARVRFRISMDESGGLGRLRTRAKYLVPNNPSTYNDLDLSFDNTTKDSSFTDLYWNKIYTVKNFIPKYYRGNKNRFLGVKDVDKGNKNNFPYNNYSTNSTGFNFILFSIICMISIYISLLVSAINSVLSIFVIIQDFINKIKGISIFGKSPFGFLPNFNIFSLIQLECNLDDNVRKYSPTIFSYLDGSANDWSNCVAIQMVTNLDVYQLDFYNDWINGALYNYLLKYKHKRNGRNKFCDADCSNSDNACVSGHVSFSTPTLNSEPSYNEQSINQGLLIRDKGVLYYSPITNSENGGKKLFATDITNLGSILDCDWQGFPKIIDYLQPTTYKLPPSVNEIETDNNVLYNVSGIFTLNNDQGLFFEVICGGGGGGVFKIISNVTPIDNNSIYNIKRQCELGVDIPETTGSTIHYITINEIYDQTESPDTSIHKFVRDAYTVLNISGSSISELSTYPNLNDKTLGTSFGISGITNNGNYYYQFANYNNKFGGSYYMYFGLIPGKTAYDKFKSKYLTECIPTINDNFSIIVDVTPSSSLIASDGVITYSFIGGIIPFTSTIEAVNYPNTVHTGTSVTVSGLTDGIYKIIATDALGTTVIREVVVSGPKRLTMYYSIVNNPSSTVSTDGNILIDYLNGGTSPYTVKLTSSPSNTLIGTYIAKQGDIIKNLSIGNYELNVTDSSNPIQSETLNFTLTSPPALTLTLDKTDNESCSGTGTIRPTIVGGVQPYTISATSTDGYITGGTYYNVSLNNLDAGNYTITVKDAINTIVTQQVTIGGNKSLNFTTTPNYTIDNTSKRVLLLTYEKHYLDSVSFDYNDTFVTGGNYSVQTTPLNNLIPLNTYDYTPAYEVVDITSTIQEYGWKLPSTGLTITATDKNGCTVTKMFK